MSSFTGGGTGGSGSGLGGLFGGGAGGLGGFAKNFTNFVPFFSKIVNPFALFDTGTGTETAKETTTPKTNTTTEVAQPISESMKRKKILAGHPTTSAGALVPKTNKKTLLG